MTTPVLYTVGHGARSLAELVEILTDAGVGLLVDVRRFPASRRHPHFHRESLARALPGSGIAYSFRGDALGGRRRPSPTSRHLAWREPGFRGYADWMESDEFQAALDGLVDDARRGPPPCVMCAETLWWRCHRRLVADAAKARGLRVVHLITKTSSSEHPDSPILRIADDGALVYDVGCLPLDVTATPDPRERAASASPPPPRGRSGARGAPRR